MHKLRRACNNEDDTNLIPQQSFETRKKSVTDKCSIPLETGFSASCEGGRHKTGHATR